MPQNSKYNKIFISYATEDFQYAERLHSFLKESGLSPWMDKRDLLPGQRWDVEIEVALRKADFILLLLSSISVSKRGYVQREFKRALRYCEERPDSDIYVIPVKIDTCEVPEKLSDFQWIEYSSNDSFGKIHEAINHQRAKILRHEELQKQVLSGFETKESTLAGQYGDRSPKQLYDITYRTFSDTQNQSLKELNIIIEHLVLSKIIFLRSQYYNNLQYYSAPKNEDEETRGFMEIDSTSHGDIKPSFLHKNLISYTSFWSEYTSGAAHGYFGTVGHNYFMNPLRSFELHDLFENRNYLEALRRVVREKLLKNAKDDYGNDISDNFFLTELTADQKDFKNYYFKEDCLVFIYNPYQLTAFSYGDLHPEISFKELRELFYNEKKLLSFIDSITRQ